MQNEQETVRRLGSDTSLVARLPWLLSILWLLLPWSVGSVVGQASQHTDQLFMATVGSALWVAWGFTLLASLIRRPWSLTTVRLAATGSVVVVVAAAIWAANSTSADASGTSELSTALVSLAIVHAVVVVAVALLPEVGNVFVDGLSYGNECRLLLRAPVGVLAGPLPLAWLVAVAGIGAAPLALANSQWVLAVVLAVVGWSLAAVAVRSLHQLANRWVVFVPNGLVLIDALATREPVLLLRKDIASIAPTPADIDLSASDLADLSGNALSVPLHVMVSTQVEIVPLKADQVSVSQVLFSPTRPGAALAAAAKRRIDVRVASPAAESPGGGSTAAEGPAAESPTAGSPTAESAAQTPARPGLSTRPGLTVAIAAVLVAITAAAAVFVSTVSPPGVPSHAVGEYRGLTIGEVRAATEANDWVLDEDQVRSNSAELGTVINQHPAAGTLLEERELLTVDVASGPLLVELPPVVGLAVSEATRRLEDSGFVVSLIAPRFDETVPDDQVIELTIDVGQANTDQAGTAQYEPGTAVTLIVSAGPLRFNVPALVGLTVAQALSVAQESDLTVVVIEDGVITDAASLGSEVISSQDPQSGAVVVSGQIVTVNIERPPTTSQPE